MQRLLAFISYFLLLTSVQQAIALDNTRFAFRRDGHQLEIYEDSNSPVPKDYVTVAFVLGCDRNNWCRVDYEKNQKTLHGMIHVVQPISIKTLGNGDAPSGTYSPEPEDENDCSIARSGFSLQPEVSNFKCESDIYREQLETCKLQVKLSGYLRCQPSKQYVSVNCAAIVETSDGESLVPGRKKGSKSKDVSLYSSIYSESFEIKVDVSEIINKTKTAKLSKVSCDTD